MSNKKKNREKRKLEDQRQQPAQQQKVSGLNMLSDSSKHEIKDMGAKLLDMEAKALAPAVENGALALPAVEQAIHDKYIAAEELKEYWFTVKEHHARLIRLLDDVERKKQFAEKLEGKLKDRETGLLSKEREVEEKERGTEQQASTYKKKLDELLALEKSLTSGEYADAVKSLLKTVADTRTGYQQETERVFLEVREAFKAPASQRPVQHWPLAGG